VAKQQMTYTALMVEKYDPVEEFGQALIQHNKLLKMDGF